MESGLELVELQVWRWTAFRFLRFVQLFSENFAFESLFEVIFQRPTWRRHHSGPLCLWHAGRSGRTCFAAELCLTFLFPFSSSAFIVADISFSPFLMLQTLDNILHIFSFFLTKKWLFKNCLGFLPVRRKYLLIHGWLGGHVTCTWWMQDDWSFSVWNYFFFLSHLSM